MVLPQPGLRRAISSRTTAGALHACHDAQHTKPDSLVLALVLAQLEQLLEGSVRLPTYSRISCSRGSPSQIEAVNDGSKMV